jgi:HD-like signal output (HDOD) protein
MRLAPLQMEFLDGFLTPAEPRPLDELSLDDRQFVAGIRNRWHTRRLELPVLAQTSLRLRELLRRGDVAVHRYAELLEQDSALTVEVLKAANSYLLGAATPVTGTADAVVRIGLQRLETILLMAQLKAKVLKGGSIQSLGDLLVRMAMPLGTAASRLAAARGDDADVAFTRGTLFQVEHLVIVGALPDVSIDHKRAVTPSVAALHQAFSEYGPEIRVAVARAWGLEDLLLGGDGHHDIHAHYSALRNALASEWLGRPLPEVPDVDGQALQDVMTRVSSPAALAA